MANANPRSPCFVYWLGPDGKTRSIYAHLGYLLQPRFVDFDGDGKTELFLIGTHNTDRAPYSQEATVVVLDRNHFSGWPGDGEFSGSSRAPFDSCLARVVFPPVAEHCHLFDKPGYYVFTTLARLEEYRRQVKRIR